MSSNSFTIVGVLVGTAGLQSLVLGQSIHGLVVKTGLESDMIVGTAMLDMYAKCATLMRDCIGLESQRLCECVHGFIVKVPLALDVSVNNSVPDMYTSLLDLDVAAKIFDEMKCKKVISWTTMIGLLIDLEYASDALELFSRIRYGWISHDTVVIMNPISACAIIGDLKKGRKVHAQAVVCGFGSELTLVNSLIAMYSKCGDLNSSRTVFESLS
nr:pentatricopeptide repeat-containing protein At1g19720-like [Quercus suber]